MSSGKFHKQDLILQSRVEVLFPVFATIGVTARLGLRYRYKIALRWDDALISCSLLFAWGLWSVWYWTTVNLIGSTEAAIRPTTPPLMQKLCFAMDVFYGEGINVVKIAILFFYLRAFGTNPNAHSIRLTIYAMMGIVAAYAVARAVETAYLCPPTCTGDVKNYGVVAWQFAMRATNWVTEVAILVIPIPTLWSMMLPRCTKIGIYACFFLGIATCCASAGRMVGAVDLYLAQIAVAKTKSTQDEVQLQQWFLDYYIPQMSRMTLWSLAELNVVIITATLPAIRSPALAFARSTVDRLKGSREGSPETSTLHTSSLDAFEKETPHEWSI